MSARAELEAIVLAPLRGRSDADWEHAAAGGSTPRWTPAQIVEHLAISMTASAERFERRRDYAPMRRRPRGLLERIAGAVILGLRWYPQGFRAPEVTRPADHVSRAEAEAHFLDGVRRWEMLERDLLPRRPADLFVRHPRFGDLTLGEWIRFHIIHARHHARQIRARLPQ